jgi:hypothetical protein
MSSCLVAGLIAGFGGYYLRDVPGTAETAWWPYALFGYAFITIAAVWLTGGFLEEEFWLRSTLILGVVFALPFWLAANWLADTPYHALAIGSWIMVGLWGVHLLVSLGAWVKTALRPPPSEQ